MVYDMQVFDFNKIEGMNQKAIIIMGDSAGGGLALGFSMYLRDNKIDVSNKLILLSPWLDLDMTNMEVKIYEKLDPMLSILSLKVSGFAWVGGNKEKLQNPYVSPIFGKFNDLPYIVTFVGTHELFYPDLVKLDNILNEEKIKHKSIVYDKMNHVFPILPIPEAKKVQNEIIEIIRNN